MFSVIELFTTETTVPLQTEGVGRVKSAVGLGLMQRGSGNVVFTETHWPLLEVKDTE